MTLHLRLRHAIALGLLFSACALAQPPRVSRSGANQPGGNVTSSDVPSEPAPPHIIETPKTLGLPKETEGAKALTDPNAYLTMGLLLVAIGQFLLYRKQINTTQVIERAYIDIAHTKPGITFDELEVETADGQVTRTVRYSIQIRNRGNTPATITRAVIHPHIGSGLPQVAQYAETEGRPFDVSLVTDKEFFVHRFTDYPASDLQDAEAGRAQLFLIGYVDYRDRFGRAHRAGYARRWERHASQGANNLVFVEAEGYNYDRELKTGWLQRWRR